MNNKKLLQEIKLLRKAIEELKNKQPVVLTFPCPHSPHVCPPCTQPHYYPPFQPYNPNPWYISTTPTFYSSGTAAKTTIKLAGGNN